MTGQPTDRSMIRRAMASISEAGRNYSATHLVRAAVQIAGAALTSPETGLVADAAIAQLSDFMSRQKRHRMETLADAFDEYAGDSGDQPGREPPQPSDFIHAVSVALDRVVSTRRGDKIRLFARLLYGYYTGMPYEHLDDYEEAVQILDDLNPKEIYILTALHRLEREYQQRTGEELDRISPARQAAFYWRELAERAENRAGIKTAELLGVMARLTRTGLYRSMTTNDYEWMKERGCLTPNFETLCLALKLDESTE